VERISNYASVSELFDLLTADFAINNDAYADDDDLADHQQMVASLRHALLQRESITEQEIVLPLNSTKVVSQSVAVQLLIRQQTLQATTKAALDTVLQHNYQQWSTLHAEIIQGQPQSKQQMADFDALQALLQSLLWCNVIHQIPCVTLVEILRQNEKAYVVLQEKILSALLTLTFQHVLTSEQRIAIEALLKSPVLMLRSLANQVLSQQGDTANSSVDLAWHYLVNKPQSATGDAFINSIQQAAASDAEQALALPLLIARGDSKTLITIADNQNYEETIRIGAIEALGRLADPQIEEKLNTLSKNDSDEDISRAAYRALRRSQRTRNRQNALSQ
jgi:ParB family chromosome partitioning protein